jgi:hypothetical protein
MDGFALRLQELARLRHADKFRLTSYDHKVYSQNGEDGIIAEIFKRIGVKDKSSVEFGVQWGLECNSLWLLIQGWTGMWIESDFACCEAIIAAHGHYMNSGHLTLCHQFVDVDNINEIIGLKYLNREIDLLSIDIDHNDYWVWRAIKTVNPRVVVIEYNGTWRPPVAITVPYEPRAVWNGTNYMGASLSALSHLAVEKGYKLVGCEITGTNAFFVRDDLVGNLFLNPGDVEEHYESAKYYLACLPAGHRAGVGPLVTIE